MTGIYEAFLTESDWSSSSSSSLDPGDGKAREGPKKPGMGRRNSTSCAVTCRAHGHRNSDNGICGFSFFFPFRFCAFVLFPFRFSLLNFSSFSFPFSFIFSLYRLFAAMIAHAHARMPRKAASLPTHGFPDLLFLPLPLHHQLLKLSSSQPTAVH